MALKRRAMLRVKPRYFLKFTYSDVAQSLLKTSTPIITRRFDRLHSDAEDEEPNQAYVVKETVRPAPRVGVTCPDRLLAVPSQAPVCRWCSSKDAEIAQLKKKVTQLEEQLCRALGSRFNFGV